jgi:transposase
MSQEPDRPDLSALPPELRAYVEAQAVARAEAEERAAVAQARAQAEAAARGHVEAELADTKSYVERLEHLVQEYRRARFGPRSEKLHPDQLALALEDLETAVAETETGAARSSPEAEQAVRRAKQPRAPRAPRALPKELPRVERVVEPDDIRCPCGCGDMVKIGEDRSERLDIVPAQFRVIATIRPRYACPKSRAGVVQAPAPAHLIEGALPTEALLAHVLVGKFTDYLPLYRQSQVFARHGVDLDRSTLADWVGQAAWHLAPIVDRMAELLKRSGKLFMDETTVPVLAPGRGRTKTGYLWAMARDDRPWNGPDPPGVVFAYAPGRGGHHGERMLAGFEGVLQVDGYGGYRRLTRPERQGGAPLTLALCIAHLRRKILDAKPKAGSPIADDLLARLAELYRIEAEIRGHDADARRAVRQQRSKPLVDALGETMRTQRARLARSSPMAQALDYGLDHWDGLTVFLDDGRVELDSNRVENLIRPQALTRKNSLFAGHDEGAANWARNASLIATCKMNGVEPFAYLKTILERLAAGHPHSRLDELLPWRFESAAGGGAD